MSGLIFDAFLHFDSGRGYYWRPLVHSGLKIPPRYIRGRMRTGSKVDIIAMAEDHPNLVRRLLARGKQRLGFNRLRLEDLSIKDNQWALAHPAFKCFQKELATYLHFERYLELGLRKPTFNGLGYQNKTLSAFEMTQLLSLDASSKGGWMCTTLLRSRQPPSPAATRSRGRIRL